MNCVLPVDDTTIGYTADGKLEIKDTSIDFSKLAVVCNNGEFIRVTGGAWVCDTVSAASDTNAITECGDNEYLAGNASTTCKTAADILSDASGITSSTGLDSLTTDEVTQVTNIDTVTINNTQWGYLGALTASPLIGSGTDNTVPIWNGTGAMDSSGVTETELAILDGATVTTSELNVLDGDTGAAGDILYHNGTSWMKLPKGTDGQVLELSSGVPSWQDISSGSGITACPSGFTMVGVAGKRGNYCISTDEEGQANYKNALIACNDKSLTGFIAKLCTRDEWLLACEQRVALGLLNMTGNWEWIAELADGNIPDAVDMGNSDCDSSSNTNVTNTSIYYRCCIR